MDNTELQPPAGRHWPKVLAGFLVLVVGGGFAAYYGLDWWLHKESREAEARLAKTEKFVRETQEFRKLADEAQLLAGITVQNGYSVEDAATARRRLQAVIERIRQIAPGFDRAVMEVESRRVDELEARERARQSR